MNASSGCVNDLGNVMIKLFQWMNSWRKKIKKLPAAEWVWKQNWPNNTHMEHMHIDQTNKKKWDDHT